MTDSDFRRVLDFWFTDCELDSPHIDARMDRWFGDDPELDQTIRDRFGHLIERASRGELDDWANDPQGRLALIIVLDQFRRNVYRGTADAYSQDRQALKLCVEGTLSGAYKTLSPEEQLFFFMPLQHAESRKVQQKSVGIYRALANRVSETLRETFLTTAQFAELHRDIIVQFGRFPHRNAVLGRENTEQEEQFLSGDSPSFGQ